MIYCDNINSLLSIYKCRSIEEVLENANPTLLRVCAPTCIDGTCSLYTSCGFDQNKDNIDKYKNIIEQ